MRRSDALADFAVERRAPDAGAGCNRASRLSDRPDPVGPVSRQCHPALVDGLAGNQPGAWNPHWLRMLSQVRALVPASWRVLVLCDRGLWSPDLYRHFCALGWHPLMRVRTKLAFTPQGGALV